MRKLLAIFAMGFLGGILGVRVGTVHAQSAVAFTMQGGGPHTTCATPATGSYFLCPATDGIWVSNNGSAYFQILPPVSGVTGVTSWNGQTGAVIYNAPVPPVLSVNGKTGVVVLGATATAPTVTLQ